MELVLGETLFGGAGGRAGNRALDEADSVRLEGLYERLPFPDYPAWWQPEAQQALRWFGGPDLLLREDSRTWLWVLAGNAAALDRARDALPGDWLLAPSQ